MIKPQKLNGKRISHHTSKKKSKQQGSCKEFKESVQSCKGKQNFANCEINETSLIVVVFLNIKIPIQLAFIIYHKISF